MSVITKVPEPNLWEEICKEFTHQKPPFTPDDDAASVTTDYSDYDPSRHNPVFYGKMFAPVRTDEDATGEFDAADSHPSCVGFTFTEKPPKAASPPPPLPPNKNTCTPTEYLNHYVFPWLLPALEAMLKQAKLEKCFERRRTKFNACDFITEHLYRHNPNSKSDGRADIELWDIPFVKEWLKDHPRPPLPMSLIWTDEEAALIIQSFWRGYLVRRDPEVQELRCWQREWREENRGIQHRVSEFWEKQMPDGDQPTPNASEQQIDQLKPEEPSVVIKSPVPTSE
ncbi:IQ domain-containing protein K isoform X2 [Aplysia californica]|uniref:IQ domain-containing protein K isoform X2 n=1 Tax=Aplysia californica TaxID=6500 RepID=A0ABM0JT50_APLCA|nr:IQ domain-containing protein K isoform X2 [Aplysia californica]